MVFYSNIYIVLDGIAGARGLQEQASTSGEGLSSSTGRTASDSVVSVPRIAVPKDKRACLKEVYSLRYGRDEVLAFSMYAASRLLGTTPEEAVRALSSAQALIGLVLGPDDTAFHHMFFIFHLIISLHCYLYIRMQIMKSKVKNNIFSLLIFSMD